MRCFSIGCRFSVVVATSIGIPVGAAQTSGTVPEVLGAFPFCEGSAAVWLGGSHLLVGDNEERGSLFAFSLNEEGLEVGLSTEVTLGEGVEISDIEAIAKVGGDELLVFGSHSRNSRCRVRDSRRRFLRGRLTSDGFLATDSGVVAMREKISCESLLGDVPDGEPILGPLCERVDTVEGIANGIWDSDVSDTEKEQTCEEAEAFNAEGAVAVSSSGGEAVWIGLRSPLLRGVPTDDGDHRDMAVLLRMRDLDEYAFDAAALVDFGGGGVRELTVSNGTVFAIAGPVADGGAEYGLWRFPIDELEAGASIAPTFVRSVPASAEGLAVIGSTAHVIIDGDRGDERCVQAAGYLAIPLQQ